MLKEFRNDYGFTLSDCARLSGTPRQSIAEFELREKKKGYFVTKKMSKYIEWTRKYRASHMTVKETAENLAMETERKKQKNKTLWQKIKNLFKGK